MPQNCRIFIPPSPDFQIATFPPLSRRWPQLGMSQFGDGGVMASKPYIASGKYIQRMSNYCIGCRYDPSEATGSNACPFTTLYWDFLWRHQSWLSKNQRMLMQLKNLSRIDPKKIATIQGLANQLRARIASLPNH